MNPNQKSPDKDLDAIAENMLEQAELFTEEANPLVDLSRSWEEEAKDTREALNVLAEADNAILNAAEPEPEFVPPKDQEELFAEVNSIVQAQNAIDHGSLEADHHYRHLERDLREPGEYNPESVIDERIKEEQKEQSEEALKNEIVDAF